MSVAMGKYPGTKAGLDLKKLRRFKEGVER